VQFVRALELGLERELATHRTVRARSRQIAMFDSAVSLLPKSSSPRS
jgi:hypothetical protein